MEIRFAELFCDRRRATEEERRDPVEIPYGFPEAQHHQHCNSSKNHSIVAFIKALFWIHDFSCGDNPEFQGRAPEFGTNSGARPWNSEWSVPGIRSAPLLSVSRFDLRSPETSDRVSGSAFSAAQMESQKLFSIGPDANSSPPRDLPDRPLH